MAPSIYKEYDCQFTSESQEINLTLKLKNMIISMQTGIAQVHCFRLLALVILL
ncbi:unknown protein [Cronobacter turicensis z3032]|uniref:Uncharacterized protein n=1 Tax=Cronobacter turicensis (strain DSM 18703 / CCUG 55852 / LMG 23827 / z3032) TaxID=693216 RepID=C9Y2Z5_CROTZ|nr:unknown protein [Cronobacter turicensis z3032]